jgi:hypothetical protein
LFWRWREQTLGVQWSLECGEVWKEGFNGVERCCLVLEGGRIGPVEKDWWLELESGGLARFGRIGGCSVVNMLRGKKQNLQWRWIGVG